MIDRDELAIYLHDYLACNDFNDYAPNGIQIEGKRKVQRIATAVTASLDIIHQAKAQWIDALLVHHGYFWKGEDPVLGGIKGERIRQLILNNITLYAYHLPLDCHVELGNNLCLGQRFDASDISMHKAMNTKNLLWSGTLPGAISADALANKLHQTLHHKPMHIAGSDKPIHRIAWCSGGAQDLIVDAHRLGVDAYISGEVSERTYYQAKELGLHYFAAGHHATERFGIQALGEHLSAHFQLEHQFIDSNNPV